MDDEEFFSNIVRWGQARQDVLSIALVGSHARGAARPDSDIDLVIICEDPAALLNHTGWRDSFGKVAG